MFFLCEYTFHHIGVFFTKEYFLISFNQSVKILFTIFFSALVFSFSPLVFSHEIKLVTEEYPPFNYLENGKVVGMSTELVEAVALEAGVSYTTTVYPWVRAYEKALHEKDVLIFSMVRTPEREALFKWVGVIGNDDFCLFSLKNRTDIVAKIKDDVYKYRVGVIRGGVYEKYFLEQGLKQDKNLVVVNRNEQIYRLLVAERIDFWVAAPLTAHYISNKFNEKSNVVLKRNYCYSNHREGAVFMAFSNETDDIIVNKFKKALARLKQNGTYDYIVKKHEGGTK